MRFAPFLLIAVVAGGLLALFHWFAPLEFTSVLTYAGIVVALAGAVSILVPLRFFAIRSRRIAAVVLAAGIICACAGLAWPAGLKRIAERRSLLDECLPEYHFVEKHEIVVDAPVDRTFAAARKVTFSELRVYDALMGIRARAVGQAPPRNPVADQPILEVMARPGSSFVPLAQNGTEIVMGMGGRPWSNGRTPGLRTAADYAAFNAPESVKIAFNLRVEDAGGGRTRLSTETRVRATDGSARSIMGRYWRLIYPGTGMIRRMWLEAASKHLHPGTEIR